jgi:hypothetical protein
MIRAIISIDGRTGSALFRFFQRKNVSREEYVQTACLSLDGSPGERIVDLVAEQIQEKLRKRASNLNLSEYIQADYNSLVIIDLGISREELANGINGTYVDEEGGDYKIAVTFDDYVIEHERLRE